MTTQANHDDGFDRALSELLDPEAEGPAAALDELAEQRMMRDVVEAAKRDRPVDEPTPSRGPALRWRLGGLAAAAAAVALAITAPSWSTDDGHSPGARLVTAAQVTVDMEPSSAGQELVAGSQLIVGAAGSASLDLGGGITAHLDGGSRATVAQIGDDRRMLALEYGKVVSEVDPLPAGSSYQVQTSLGTVEVVGTVFTVTAREGRVDVHVDRGHVRVHETNRGEHLLAAGDALALPSQQPGAQPEPPPAVAPEEPATPVPPAQERAPKPEPKQRATVVSLEELMGRATEQRTKRRWREAAQTYAEIWRSHPSSKQACTVLVSRAQLLIDRLSDAKAAVRDLDTHTSSCGSKPLAEEAAWQRTRALRALGRSAEERTALTAFLMRHKTSLNRAAARLRLADLDRGEGRCADAVATYRELAAGKSGARIAKLAKVGLAACKGE